MLKPATVFSDHMVLQRDTPLPIWGWAEPGDTVSVSFADQTRETTAGPDGRWNLQLGPLPASAEPRTLTLTTPGEPAPVAIRDVLVGEVWLCSGQSNMQFTVAAADRSEEEIPAAQHPGIRMFTVARVAVAEHQTDVDGVWNVCEPNAVAEFSAVGYFFGRALHERLTVPVGLIDASWGGTRAEAWASRDSLMQDPDFAREVEDYERLLPDFERRNAEYQVLLEQDEAAHYPADPGNLGLDQGWAATATDVSDWDTLPVPGMWQSHGLNFSGVVWFRRDVGLPANWAGKDLLLSLGPCDKFDVAYFNGTEIGHTDKDTPEAWSVPRRYRIPGELVHARRNTLAVRIYSYAFAGGFTGSPAQMSLTLANEPNGVSIPLAGRWLHKVEHNFGVIQPLTTLQPLGPGNPASPYSLYRGMIEPLIPFAIRGTTWYQGESNAGKASAYRGLFALMIRGWRKAWGYEFPFLFVQLANYLATPATPVESAWAELREAQRRTLDQPATGMAVAIDIGDASDIHPRNKQDVGRRLAAWALHSVYGHTDVPPSGPLPRQVSREGDRLRIAFDHAWEGLATSDGKPPRGFALAGTDRTFHWGEASLDGDTVLVQCPRIAEPVTVRYAWADNPDCSLTNGVGLPASPFEAPVA